MNRREKRHAALVIQSDERKPQVADKDAMIDLYDDDSLSSMSLGRARGASYGALPTSALDSGLDDIPKEKASMLSSVSNLANTILGAGMLGLPWAIEAMGLGLGCAMLIISGLGAYWGLYLLTIEGKYVKRGHASFFNIAQVTYPFAAVAIDVTMCIKCFGVATSYLIVIADLMPDALRFFLITFGAELSPDSFFLSRTFWLLVFLVPAVWLASLKRLDDFRFTSYFAIATVVYIVFIVVYFFFKLPHTKVELAWFRLNTEFFSALPIFFFSFTCHQNILTIYNELQGDEAATNRVSQLSMVVSVLTYFIIGLFGFFTFGKNIHPNILTGYPSTDVVVTLARIAISLHVLYSYRLQMHPSRTSLLNIVRHFSPTTSEHWSMHWVTTFLLCGGSFAIAFMVTNLGIVFGIIGATGSTLLCYILPGLFYLGLHRGEPWRLKKVLALLSMLLGVLLMLTCVTFIIFNAAVLNK